MFLTTAINTNTDTTTATNNNDNYNIFFNFAASSQFLHRDKKHVSRAMLSLRSMEKGLTVACLVRHPALHAHHILLDFITFNKNCEYNYFTKITF